MNKLTKQYLSKVLGMKILFTAIICLVGFSALAQKGQAQNPVIFADVPDMSIVRVDDTYYMSSTTMHMNPGVPIMKSKDLTNWELIGYAYDKLADMDALNLENGQSTYGRGSWASCLRYVNETYYVSTFAKTTGETYIFSTNDIEKGDWKMSKFKPSYHDHTLHFADDGKVYMIWGGGTIKMIELKEDLSGVKEGTERVLIENAQAPIKEQIMLPAEGSQLFEIDGKFYLFNIVWPRGGMRTVLVHRADNITGPYEGRIAFQDKGVAQGGLIDTPDGRWFSYLFRDYGAVGRIPYLVPVQWKDGWPILGVEGKVPDVLDLPTSKGLIPGIVASDEFTRKKGNTDLPLVWQWNHNPDHENWSLKARKGSLRITTGRVDTSFFLVRNMLTQRAIGPECSGETAIELSNMKNGDFAGLTLLQKKYGQVGVKMENGKKYIVMTNSDTDKPVEIDRVDLNQDLVYLKAECDFRDKTDTAEFYYSLDGKQWKHLGNTLHMAYTLPHFMGYRFGLFNYSTKEAGGFADFDYFRITDKRTEGK